MTPNVPEPPPESPRRILLVEDDADASRGLSRLLELNGYFVTAVPDGRSAIEFLNQGIAPDVLLTDVQLPDLDGLSVAREARRRHPSTRIALITGWDFRADDQELKTLGIDGVLLKPFEIQTLVAFIEKSRPPGA